MSMQIFFEIGHEASIRTKRTPEGFTHDWEVFVRGYNGTNLSYIVEKVVFHLHDTFTNPKRVIKQPPYIVKESGYAGFILPIEIYFKCNSEPKKIKFNYDLTLQPSGPAIYKVQKERQVFKNPNDDLKISLTKGGAIIVNTSSIQESNDSRGSSDSKGELVNKPKLSGIDSMKKYKNRIDEQRSVNSFQDLFGTPITKTNRIFSDPKSTTSKDSSKSTSSSVIKSDKDKDKSKDKGKFNSPNNKEREKEKDKDKSKEKSELDRKKERDDKKSKERSRDKEHKDKSKREKSPRPQSPSPRRSPKRPTSPKQRPPSPPPPKYKKDEKDDKRGDSNKDRDKKEKSEDKKFKKEKREKEHKEKKDKELQKSNDKEHRKDKSNKDTNDRESPANRKPEKKEKTKEKESKDEVKEIESLKATPERSEKQKSDKSEEKKEKHKHKKKDKEKKDKEKDKSSKDKSKDKEKPVINKQPESKIEKDESLFSSPKSEERQKKRPALFSEQDLSNSSISSREDFEETKKDLFEPNAKKTKLEEKEMNTKEKKKEKSKKHKDRKAEKEERKRKRKAERSLDEPPEKIAKEEIVQNVELSDSEDESNRPTVMEFESNEVNEKYFAVLKDLYTKITKEIDKAKIDNAKIQEVVKMVYLSGRYEMTPGSFDFDLCVLEESTIRQLQAYLTNS